MPHCTRTKEDVASRIADMFRLAERDYGMDLNRLAMLSGMSYDTLKTYRSGAAMPLHAFVQIAPYVADELLSMCLTPARKHVASDEAPDGGAHELARDAGEYNVTYLNAVDPNSEAGSDISPRERAKLRDVHRRMKARRVA